MNARPPRFFSAHVFKHFHLLFVFALIASGLGSWGGTSVARAEGPNAILTLPNATGADGCKETVLPANDDESSYLSPIGFGLNFFNRTYDQLYVNNNGNVTFENPLSTYTPFDLNSTSEVIIAPFFADVDTRGTGSEPVTYSFGDTTYGGRRAFCVNWVNVGYFYAGTDKLNSFQLVLVDRSDTGTGNFDIMFNYDKVQWEAGSASDGIGGLGGNSARAGYSNGISTSLELPGSAVNGAFLDSNTATGLIHNSRDSLQLGRYIFPVRSGDAPIGGTISGSVFANTMDNVLAGASVQVCSSVGRCNVTSSSASGAYTVSGLPEGQYNITAFPPSGSSLNSGMIGPISLASGVTLSGQDIVLTGPTPPPAGTTIESLYTTSDGIPVISYNTDLDLLTTGCTGGTATYRILQGSTVLQN